MNEIILAELDRAKRNNKPLSFIMFDIDHFKKINDTYGHKIGDRALISLTHHIKKNIRQYDTAFRYGGDEFLIITPELNAVEAQKRAEELREATKHIEIPVNGNKVITFTISIGIASYPNDSDTPEELITKADKALYKAKETGRDKVVIYSSLKPNL